jgi:site-specific DNA-methyltransferase (adenine-specific)
MIRIIKGDCLQEIPKLVAKGIIVDSCVCDPPYHLTSVARGQTPGSVAAAKDVFKRVKMGGFMGMGWDGGDVAFRPETWATIATVMRPGAFLLSFGGTRTFHRVACAIEDGGLIIQDCLMWLYGTGFPKRRDMLKPAYEPIILAYKPGGDRTMQIDECRIGIAGGTHKHDAPKHSSNGIYGDGLNGGGGKGREIDAGRWPANICHDGSDEVVSIFPNSEGQLGDLKGHNKKSKSPNGIFGEWGPKSDAIARRDEKTGFAMQPGERRSDYGSAARFFWSPKAGKKDRNGSKHPTIKPVGLLDWLVPLVTPVGGTVLDPFAGSGTTGQAALNTGRNAILIEREPEYIADIQRRFYGTSEDALRELTAAIREMIDGLR